jgi:hypothetical protein
VSARDDTSAQYRAAAEAELRSVELLIGNTTSEIAALQDRLQVLEGRQSELKRLIVDLTVPPLPLVP